jgi:type II secretory pathway pseudopilin PulG
VTRTHSESGFSIIELLVAMGVLLTVSSIVTTALLQMTKAQGTIWNRTEMHSGIRGATELLQQEVGQAGRISFPTTVTLGSAINPVGGAAPAASVGCDAGLPLTNAATVPVSSVSGMFATGGLNPSYILLTTLDGDASESIKVGQVLTGPPRIVACFANAHLAGTVLVPMGGFATGIIPPKDPDPTHTPPVGGYPGYPDGSTATKLKLFGDINGDGNMVYVEYTCDTTAGTNKLFRQVRTLDPLQVKGAPTDAEILLGNIMDNPAGTPCFVYQYETLTVQGTLFTFVIDVAVTLTVQTQEVDPVTKQFQKETKALLNVSPRNVFNTWSLASIGYTDRVQSTPTSVTTLLP